MIKKRIQYYLNLYSQIKEIDTLHTLEKIYSTRKSKKKDFYRSFIKHIEKEGGMSL